MHSRQQNAYSFLQLYAAEIAYKLVHDEIDEAKATALIVKAAYRYAKTQKRSQNWKRSRR